MSVDPVPSADFLADILRSLERSASATVLRELRDGATASVTGSELLNLISQARTFLRGRDLKKGDRCALVAHNSIRWVAMDLAIMEEGLICVPLYARQAVPELVAMMKDCGPGLVICGDESLRGAISQGLPGVVTGLLDDGFKPDAPGISVTPGMAIDKYGQVVIIYTSGTSGEAKGVVLSAGNIAHMLACTSGRLDQLMGKTHRQDRVFHYLPFCFAGSWIMLLTCLLRGNLLTLNTDLTKLAGDMRTADADYFLNVPALLERMRKAVDEQLWKTGGFALAVYSRAKGAWIRRQEGKQKLSDALWSGIANSLVFPTIRKKMLGSNLRALICGSAPLSVETQQYFNMLGIIVLQVYGLTETTAICTMDDPRGPEPGRVGPAIQGVEMKLGESGEILARGPNIFPGYWNRPEQTAQVLRDGWFHTGDQGEVDGSGNWKIIGRIKNLIVLGSGHNIAPEPIEDRLLHLLPGAQHVVLIGNGRGYLTAVVTGSVETNKVEQALNELNATLPHYKQIRGFHLHPEGFSIENGLLTANGKLKRDAIAERLRSDIENMYRTKMEAAG
jgi:long-chain acyl-CoA synthetase